MILTQTNNLRACILCFLPHLSSGTNIHLLPRPSYYHLSEIKARNDDKVIGTPSEDDIDGEGMPLVSMIVPRNLRQENESSPTRRYLE